jgi:anhydro-N-acetylmuramic acid kinase
MPVGKGIIKNELIYMMYRALGLMSGSSLDGLDIVFAEFIFESGSWRYELLATDCYEYDKEWKERLKNAIAMNALDYQLLHTEYGHYLGRMVNRFIEDNELHYKVGLIASHGHTTFHMPHKKMTAQLGDGASIAAETGLPVVSDLRALDVAFGGQGAPIVPIGEKLLWKDYGMFLNLGGIANISFKGRDSYVAFDICPANAILNLLAALRGKEYDEDGIMASKGKVHAGILQQLNTQDYYRKPYPKSLANDFGTQVIFPLLQESGLSVEDALRTYVQHITQQVRKSIEGSETLPLNNRLMVTGGGALNSFLIGILRQELTDLKIEMVIPDQTTIKFKEALIMAFFGVLRWRQEYNILSSVTGAERDSIGGAVWIGQEG